MAKKLTAILRPDFFPFFYFCLLCLQVLIIPILLEKLLILINLVLSTKQIQIIWSRNKINMEMFFIGKRMMELIFLLKFNCSAFQLIVRSLWIIWVIRFCGIAPIFREVLVVLLNNRFRNIWLTWLTHRLIKVSRFRCWIRNKLNFGTKLGVSIIVKYLLNSIWQN